MLRRLITFCVLLLLAAAPFGLVAPAAAGVAAPGEYLVGYAPGTGEAQRSALIAAAGGRLVRALPALSADLVAFPTSRVTSGSPAEDRMMATLAADEAVRYVEPNESYRIHAPYVPDDQLLDQQYAWAQIEAFEGWDMARGSPGVVIAIIDSGVQFDHPDLAAKLVPGYDFVQRDDDPSDERGQGHGTHVAGIAAASTNNAVGVAGTCPECRLMPVRVINAAGSGYLDDIAAGIVYAVDNGARVINLSLGGPGSQTLKAAVDYAAARGVFLSCSAGNDGTTDTSRAYPAAYEACFAVAATTAADLRAGYSNYGSWVEVAAPGDEILSTDLGNSYAVRSGTSMAAPHVAGLAGLLASQGYSGSAIRDRICATADPIAGTGTSWTCGRINLARALDAGAPAFSPRTTYLPAVIR